VVMCTHLLLEAEGLADQVVVLQDGTDVVSGAPAELIGRYWPEASVRVGFEGSPGAELLAALDGVVGVTGWECRDGTVEVRIDDASRVPDVVGALAGRGARITRVLPHEPTLEDLYFAVRQGRGASRLGAVEGSTV
jgi:ABC-2 type transport system ATP-binding protein